ncbi:major facilitator superfamily domain-containing protein [Flagelloscypha sp. PMI_526]|nr:major facilitator superfamily domain-containing protein [Flagelloscypha sp. PMI_526]
MHDKNSSQEWHESSEMRDIAAKYVPGSDAEKALVRKIDKRIVPTVWVLYTLSYLDRANIGNAKVGGMEKALGLTSEQYSVVLLVFFISYVLFEIPSNMILSRVRPSLYLSGLCFIWGCIAASMGAVKNWQELAGVRFALGVAEAGFAPGIAFYLSSWYKRTELAQRYSIYYTATAISGAFSGLLAGVITEHLKLARGIEGWRWLLIIEGVASSFAALFTWMILPDWPATTKWLTPEERALAAYRLKADGIAVAGDKQKPSHSEALKMAFGDWRTWMLVVMYMLATGAQTIQYFIPTLVSQLGYSGYHAQFMTIPVYATAFVCILTFCFASDWKKDRPTFITIAALLSCVCFIIIVSITSSNVAKFVFLCFAVGGIYAACPLTLLWVSWIIDHPAEKRAVAIALVNGLGNSASIYGSFLWPSKTGPRYIQGFAVTTVFVFLVAFLAQVNRYLLAKYPARGLNDDESVMRQSTSTPNEKDRSVSPSVDNKV